MLFDRDDTLIADVPYNGDPSKVRAVPGARAAVDEVRRHGIPVGVVTNQSGIGQGLLSAHQVAAVNAEVTRRLGPFQVWEICPHTAADGCACRKPRPGMLLAACRRLGVDPALSVYIGDIGADMDAAEAAGARGILVPTARTRAEEIAAAETVAETLGEAVQIALAWSMGRDPVAASTDRGELR